MMGRYSVLLALLIALACGSSNAYEYSACLFKTCECVGDDPGRDVVVRCSPGGPTKDSDFPIAYENKTQFDQQIEILFVSSTKINKTLVDYAFKGLRIKQIHFYGNNMESLGQHMLDGIVGLQRLGIIEMMLRKVEPGAFDWISSTLAELSLVQSGINNISYAEWLPELSKLVNLEKIDLTRNELTSLVDGSLDAFTKLESLNLERNKLEYLGENVFKMNTKLKYLNLIGNRFKSIQSVLTALRSPVLSSSLNHLLLDENKFTELAEFPPLANLKQLSLNTNMLKTITGQHFRYVRNLNVTSFSYNPIESIDDDLGYYLTKLNNLYLRYNSISNMTFLKSFRSSSLRVLDLSSQRSSQLRQLADYSFERTTSSSFMGKTETTSKMDIILTDNYITNFSSKVFCSRSSFDLGINRLVLSYHSLANMNKCLLRQLQTQDPARMVEIEVVGQDSYNNSRICGCSEFRLLASQSNVNLTGGCSQFNNLDIASCRRSLGIYSDDCYQHTEFMCPPVQTTSLTPAGTAAMIIGGAVAGALLFVSFALLGTFLVNRLKK